MRSKLLHEIEGQKTYALIFESGDDVMSNLKSFAQNNKLSGSRLTAIGAF
jgi:predicted DNA-binding protein with PD1-like motif